MGDKVDVHVYGDVKKNGEGWLQGVIEEAEGDNLNVIFPKASAEFDKTINRWSYDLAPFEVMTKEDYAWRATLEGSKVEVQIDCHDKIKWEEGTIVRSKMTSIGALRPFEEVEVGFRIYTEMGKNIKKDDKGRSYIGYSERLDQWIPLYSPKIQPHLTRTVGSDSAGSNRALEIEKMIDD